MPSDRETWEARHAHSSAAPPAPSLFLERWAHVVHGRVLEVAAGSGRNTLLLARQGHRVDAIDIAASGLHQIRTRAAAEGLDVHCIQADLMELPLPPLTYDAIVNVRYLQRSLFDSMRRSLRPGGVILFETFLIDQRTVGHPKNQTFLLEHGELRRAFADLDLLFYSEGLLDNEDRPAFLAQLAARKREL